MDRVYCEECEAEFVFAEDIGTTSMYVTYCPACGAERPSLTVEEVED